MAVGTTQLFDGTMKYIAAGTIPLWNAATSYYFSLWQQAGQDPGDDEDDYTAFDVTYTKATGDGATLLTMGSGALVGSAGQCGFDSAIATWGSPVTIDAKYLVCFDGTIGAQAGTDKCVFWVDLDTSTTSAEASSSAGTFSVDAHADGWFYIAAQA